MVEELNRVGIMVDLSHASKKTAMDVLDVSTSGISAEAEPN